MKALPALLLPMLLPAAVATQESGRITRVADMPTPRAAHSATLLHDGRVLLAGGCRADSCEEGMTGDALLFDPARMRFTAAGDLVQTRVGHRAVALKDGSVLLIGGWSGSSASASIERYDPVAGTFEPHGNLLNARDAFTATSLPDGSILIAGGYSDSGMRPLAESEIYDPLTRTSKSAGKLATPRKSHTATALPDGRVLISGGSDSRRSVTGSLELFDPTTGAFAPAGNLAMARHKHAAVLFGDEVWILGGASIPESVTHFADTERWSIRSQRVSPGPHMAEGRYKFLDAAIALSDGVLVAGSGRTAELLDESGDRFVPIDVPLGQSLAFSTATPLRDGSVLIVGGYDPDIRTSRAAWIYRQ